MSKAEKKKSLGKLFVQGTKEMRHDLFKLKNASCKKNRGLKPKFPRIEEATHNHIFRSFDVRRGVENKYTDFKAGHCHEVLVKWDESGEEIVEIHCGPPLKEISVKTQKGFKKKLVPIKWEVHESVGGGVITDEHTHELEYEGTQFYTMSHLSKYKQEQRQIISGAMERTPGAGFQKSALESLEAGAEKAKEFGIKEM